MVEGGKICYVISWFPHMQVQFGEQIITCQSIHKRTIAKKHFSFHIIYYKTPKEDKKTPKNQQASLVSSS